MFGVALKSLMTGKALGVGGMAKDWRDMASLFDKLTIGNMTARNRMVRAATAESLAASNGCPTPELLGIYGELAWGGVGTIITGYTYVTPDGKPSEGALGLYDDAFLHHFRSLADVAHENGARIILQLVYGGSKSKLAVDDSRWTASADQAASDGVPNVVILGASSVMNPRTHLVPIEATPDQLASLVDAFGQAAVRARACGFDGVEIHVAHGYLLSQFLSPHFNRRADEYGGSLEGRARLAVQCVEAVRAQVGSEYPVLVKLNSCDDWEDPAGVRGGLGEDESAQVAAWLVRAGANCVDVSGDWHAASSATPFGEPYFAAFGARLAHDLDVPVIVTGGWRDPVAIAARMESDGIAGVALSRPFICEPDLPRRWVEGSIVPSACTECGICQKHVGIPCPVREKSMA